MLYEAENIGDITLIRFSLQDDGTIILDLLDDVRGKRRLDKGGAALYGLTAIPERFWRRCMKTSPRKNTIGYLCRNHTADGRPLRLAAECSTM